MTNDSFTSSDDGIRGTKSPLWLEDGKTLSKNLMYAPLVAYQKSAIGASDQDSKKSSPAHPSQYMSNKKNVPTSLRESSLSSTLHFVSCDYHRNRATVNDAKNNGSRPLGLPDMEDRIRQRAVTLVGGGINSSIPVSKKTTRSKKRRHRSWEEAEPRLKKSSLEAVLSGSEPSHVVSFLQQLNTTWNEYAWNLLTSDKEKSEKRRISEDDLKEIEVRLGALVNKKNSRSTKGGNFNRAVNSKDDKIDLIGSHLKIDTNNAHTSWVGRFGVLVGETTNTYRIASLARRSKKTKSAAKESQRKKKHQQKENFGSKIEKGTNSKVEKTTGDFVKGTDKSKLCSTSTDDKYIEILVLPKRGTVLQLILPLVLDECKESDNDKDQASNAEGITPPESMIPIPDEAIGICIVDQ